MAISQQIVTEKHSGQLHCLSVFGQGTLFTVEIPLRQTQSVPFTAAIESSQLAGVD
jgi:signal transduction histidine kinase